MRFTLFVAARCIREKYHGQRFYLIRARRVYLAYWHTDSQNRKRELVDVFFAIDSTLVTLQRPTVPEHLYVTSWTKYYTTWGHRLLIFNTRCYKKLPFWTLFTVVFTFQGLCVRKLPHRHVCSTWANAAAAPHSHLSFVPGARWAILRFEFPLSGLISSRLY